MTCMKIKKIKVSIEPGGYVSEYFPKHMSITSTDVKEDESAVFIDNLELSGYRLEGHKTIIDPRGFRIGINQDTLFAILECSILVNNLILTPLTFMRFGTTTTLVSIESEAYKNAEYLEDSYVTLNEVEPGTLVTTMSGYSYIVGHNSKEFSTSKTYMKYKGIPTFFSSYRSGVAVIPIQGDVNKVTKKNVNSRMAATEIRSTDTRVKKRELLFTIEEMQELEVMRLASNRTRSYIIPNHSTINEKRFYLDPKDTDKLVETIRNNRVFVEYYTVDDKQDLQIALHCNDLYYLPRSWSDNTLDKVGYGTTYLYTRDKGSYYESIRGSNFNEVTIHDIDKFEFFVVGFDITFKGHTNSIGYQNVIS